MTKRKPSKLKPEKIKELEETRSQLRNLESLITKILNGNISQTDAAKQLGMTVQSFHNDDHLHRQIARITHFDKQYLLNLLYSCRTPYEKLIYAIFGIEQNIVLILPEDINEKLETLMQNRLNDQEYTVICAIFGIPDEEPKTLEQVGKLYNRTRERIRQIELKALRKLRRPSLYKQMLSDYDLYIQSLNDLPALTKMKREMEEICQQTALTNQEIDQLTKKLQEEKERLNARIQKNKPPISDNNPLKTYSIILSDEELTVFHKLGIKTVHDLKCMTDYQLAVCIENVPHLQSLYTVTNLHYPKATVQLLLMPTQELGCSMRLYNVLTRAGYHTVGNIIQHTEEEIKELRNIGTKTYDELINILNQLGLHLLEQ